MLLTDQEEDAETGLYNYNARLYDPALRMFVSADTIIPDLYNPQSLNPYSYCLNNPLIYTDPSGHDPNGYDPHEVDKEVAAMSNSNENVSVFAGFTLAFDSFLTSPTATTTTGLLSTTGLMALTVVSMPFTMSGCAPPASQVEDSSPPDTSGNIDTGQGTGTSPAPGDPNDEKPDDGDEVTAKQDQSRTLQRGGNSIKQRTADAFGKTKREVGRALEAMKKEHQLGNNFHQTTIKESGNVFNRNAGQLIDNLHNYLP